MARTLGALAELALLGAGDADRVFPNNMVGMTELHSSVAGAPKHMQAASIDFNPQDVPCVLTASGKLRAV